MEKKGEKPVTSAEVASHVEKELSGEPTYMEDMVIKHGKEMLPRKTANEKAGELGALVGAKAAVKIADVNPISVETVKAILAGIGEKADEKTLEKIMGIMRGK
jgi:DNA-directed RNA polymerase subunit F